ncbi:MAG: hypothetical protein HRT61_24990 [Ekhidna sp.]|nr:hypothetical protein [Ekhidna sp.]
METSRYPKEPMPSKNKKPRYKPKPRAPRKRLKTCHPTGGLLLIGDIKQIEPPEGSFQRFPIGTVLYPIKWNRFDENKLRHYLYEDHFLSYYLEEWESGARIYRSHVRNLEKYTTDYDLRSLPPVYKKKKIIYRPDKGVQGKLW